MAVSSRREHFDRLFTQIKNNTSTINKGYNVAIDYYKRMKDYFGKMLGSGLQENSDQALKKFKKDLKILFNKKNGNLREDRIKEIMNNLFYKAGYGANGNQSLLKVIESLLEEQDGGEKLKKLKEDIKEVRENLEKDAEKQSEEIKRLIAEATKGIKNDSKILSGINSIISSAAGVNTNGIDTDDLINNIILPYFRRYLAIDPEKNEKVGLFYAVASGFVFEACVADALIKLFENIDNIQASHSGKQNRQDDILITKEKIDEEIIEDLLAKFRQPVSGRGESNTLEEEITNFLETQFDKGIYGIQVKNAALLNNLTHANKADLDRFDRISNQNVLLQQFRSQEKFNGRIIEKEEELTPEEYGIRVLQAIQFLSKGKHIQQVMGEFNVAYIDKSGLIWTDSLLALIRRTKHYLCFKAAIGTEQNVQGRNFEAAVGIRDYDLGTTK